MQSRTPELPRPRWRTKTRARRRLLGTLAAAALTGIAVPAAQANVPDISERRIMTPTGWSWLTGVSAEQLDAKVADGFRVFDLEVDQTSPYRFTAALVANSGAHAGASWWYYDNDRRPALDAAHTAGRLHQGPRGELQRRREALQRRPGAKARPARRGAYCSQLRFDEIADEHCADTATPDSSTSTRTSTRASAGSASSWSRNAGVDATPWWLLLDLTAAEIQAKLQEHSARITDIELRSQGPSGPTFTVILEPNAAPRGRGTTAHANRDRRVRRTAPRARDRRRALPRAGRIRPGSRPCCSQHERAVRTDAAPPGGGAREAPSGFA